MVLVVAAAIFYLLPGNRAIPVALKDSERIACSVSRHKKTGRIVSARSLCYRRRSSLPHEHRDSGAYGLASRSISGQGIGLVADRVNGNRAVRLARGWRDVAADDNHGRGVGRSPGKDYGAARQRGIRRIRRERQDLYRTHYYRHIS